MELTQLEYFLTVARLQHMTMASKALNLTQPALSHAISKLENELGVPLFERNGRNVHLNRYGEMFSKWVEEALKNIQNGMHEIDELSNPETGVVHISYLNILGVDLVPSIIKDYQVHLPKVRFDLYQGNHGDIDEYLDKGTSDMLITSKESTLDNHEWIVIRKLPLFIVVSSQHHFASRSSLSLFELSGEKLISKNKLLDRIMRKVLLDFLFHEPVASVLGVEIKRFYLIFFVSFSILLMNSYDPTTTILFLWFTSMASFNSFMSSPLTLLHTINLSYLVA
ncbi:LysR family transcriptional regulator [Paenibacillus filicis]|uniref:LysR family transcriptional regulator n=1 Tax=Paenibacillus gyeongsangnamensis TaxID=3388067 RepID=A0ABT4Q1V2_9BACL|nr:LysR family transcriptional regulator [Paenibacillus filicis]MCZ8510863.1 LysR family transcriptional regulator [Paenibacillus filicis]